MKQSKLIFGCTLLIMLPSLCFSQRVVDDLDSTISSIFRINEKILDSLANSADTATYRWFGKRWQRWKIHNYDMLGDMSKTPREYIALRNGYNANTNVEPLSFPLAGKSIDVDPCPSDWTELGAFGVPAMMYDGSAQLSRGVGNGRVDFVKYDQQNDRMFICSNGGGLFLRDFPGTHWYPTGFDNIRTTGASWVEVSNSDPDIWFVATGGSDKRDPYKPSDGVYRTKNGGDTWEKIDVVLNDGGRRLSTNYAYPWDALYIRKILLHPSNHDILYAATNHGVFRCDNATSGSPVWTLVLGRFNGTNNDELFLDIEFKPGNPSVVMASGDYAYISSFSGDLGTWSKIGDIDSLVNQVVCSEHKVALAVTPANPDRLVMFLSQRPPQGSDKCNSTVNLYYLDDVSQKWKHLGYYNPRFNGDDTHEQTLILSKLDETKLIFGTQLTSNVHLWTIDYGSNSVSKVNYKVGHDDTRFINSQIVNGTEEFYLGNDGQVLKVNDINSWSSYQDMTSDLNIVTAYAVGGSEFDINAISYGAQDNMAVFKMTGTSWMYGPFGDGNGAMGDKYDKNVVYLSEFANGNLSRIQWDPATQKGTSSNIMPSSTNPIYEDVFFRFDQNNFDTDLYYGGKGLARNRSIYRSTWEELDAETFTNNKGEVKRFNYYSIQPSPVSKDVLHAVLVSVDPEDDPTFRIRKSMNVTSLSPSFQDIDLTGLNALSTNGQVTWMKIASDDQNENAFWIGVPGYTTVHGNMKVAYYDGNLFSDITGNLPPDVSIQCITKQPGPSNIVYVGTTRGVYKTRGNTGVWEEMCGIPYAKVTDLEINQCAQKLRAATLGRGIWEASLEKEEILELGVSGTIEIPRDPPINVTIETGTTAIVTGQVNMPIGGKIVVKRGGKLIVDGGTITCNCGFWSGIEVEGDKNASTIDPIQGQVQVINGGTIKNARMAISTSKKINGVIQWDYTGGVITLDGANFIDNWKDLEFLTYHDPNRPLVNRSNIKNTSFKRTPRYSFLYTDVSPFVSLNNVAGIEFQSCQFINEVDDIPNVNEIGILSGGSHFSVSGTCTLSEQTGLTTRCTDWDAGSFENLTTAIKAVNMAPSIYTPSITQTNFKNCYEGIRLEGVVNATVHDNTFELHTPHTALSKPYGIYLRGCTGYGIYDNAMNGNAASDFGIIVNNSAPDANIINRNDFNGLDVGLLIEGENRDWSTGAGLVAQCNNFSLRRYQQTPDINGVKNTNDIVMVSVNNTTPAVANAWGNLFAVANNQLANNYFSDNCISGHNQMEGSLLSHGLRYVYGSNQGGTRYQPNCYSSSKISLRSQQTPPGFNYDIDCNFMDDDDIIGTTLQAAQQEFQEAITFLTSKLITNLNVNFVNQMQDISSVDMASLKQSMLDASPYLSSEVFNALIALDASNYSGFQSDILQALSPVSVSRMEWIQKVNPDLYAHLVTIPLATSIDLSEVELLELDVLQKKTQYKLLFDHFMRQQIHSDDLLRQSTIDRALNAYGVDFESYRWVMYARGLIKSDAVMDGIMVDFADMQAQYMDNGTLSADQVASVSNHLGSVSSFYAPFAEAVDAAINGTEYNEVIAYPVISAQHRAANLDEEQLSSMLNVVPNPGTGQFKIQISAGKFKEGTLVLFDIQGRMLYSHIWNDEQENLSLNLDNYPKGMYLLKFISKDQTYIEHSKIILQ